MKAFLIILVLGWVKAPQGFAQGSGHTGGGDACERRIHEIRKDLRSWVARGGSKLFKFKAEQQNKSQYDSRMLDVLADNRVLVSCVASWDSVSKPVQVNGEPKTCIWMKKQSGDLQIRCDLERFFRTSESDQYRLIHHEFANLAGFELNVGARSNYELSDQITDFLRKKQVLRLSVKERVRPEQVQVFVMDKHDDLAMYASVLFKNALNGIVSSTYGKRTLWDEPVELHFLPKVWLKQKGRQEMLAHLQESGASSLVFSSERFGVSLIGFTKKIKVYDQETRQVLFEILVSFSYSGFGYLYPSCYLDKIAIMDGAVSKSVSN